jgi:hypothetical protein
MVVRAEIPPGVLGAITSLHYVTLDRFVAFQIALVYTLP